MRRISELMEDVPKAEGLRSVMRPGESLFDYVEARMKAPDPIAFDARRLLENGWTAEMEGRYQSGARALVHDGDALIIALEKAVEEKRRDEESAAKARQLAQDRIAEARRKSETKPRPQPDRVVLDDDDIPLNF